MPRRCGVLRGLLVGSLCLAADWNGISQSVRKEQVPREYTIRTTSRLLLLDAGVRDATGGFVSGLVSENFKVYEDGKPQQITQFAHADIPVTVGLVVDESASMRPKRTEVITAGLAFIQASNPQDKIFIINFNEKARRGLPETMLFSDEVKQLREALWRGVPEGRTALYDAIEMALHHLEYGRRDKKALVVVSDGGDNVSLHKVKQMLDDVLTSVATIYAIGIFDENDPDKSPGILSRIAHLSGGNAYFPSKLDEVVSICQDIAKDIRNRYTIGYVPSAGEGISVRHIKVLARSPNGKKLIVRSRSTYLFTPDAGEDEPK
jgi:Ca-activated chloride channel family protein